MRIKLVTATLGLALLAVSNLQASIIFVSTRSGLGGNDSVDWGQLGASFTSVPSPSPVLSANGLVMTVTSSGGTMERRDQGNGWNGNFAPGDRLLWNGANNGDISIEFSTGIYGLGGGAQVQADFFGTFIGTITAYDGANNTLLSQSFNGVSTSDGDNSAVFAGILSSTADIHKITFSVSDINNQSDFAINQLDLVTAVPEPSTCIAGALLLLPFGAQGIRMLRNRKA